MQVVAAVIERDGRVLVCQRKRGGRHALKWEFPGGKVEPGEDSVTALRRELREELAIEASIGALLHFESFQYASGPPFQLEFYRVAEFLGEPSNLQFEAMVWEEPGKLAGYDFLDGDVEFVKKLGNLLRGPR